MAISKITLNGVTQMDVTQKTVTANTMLNGVTSLKNDGTDITGNIASKTSSDLTVSGATVTAPAGYYGSAATKSVASGTAGTPTATKGTVTNNSVSITPSVTNTTGYITGSTKTGTAVTVSASELVSGTKSISANGTGIDVTNYASVNVAVPSGSPSLQAKTNINPTTSSQTIRPDTGYDGLSSVQINAMPSGSATAPASISGTSATVSTGTNTLTLSKTVSVTPSVTAGYISSGTAGNSSISLTASVNTRSSSDLTASGATVTAPAGYYGSAATKTVASGSATAPASISGTSATVSTGTNTLTLSKTISVTPSVTAGYVSSGTAGNSSVSLTANVNTRSSSDLTVSGGTVTAPAGYYGSAASKSVESMTLPTSSAGSATSGYVEAAVISSGNSDQYINIPPGFNTTGAYYKINSVDYESVYITDGVGDYNGVTIVKESANSLKMYGTATASRRLLILNGQNSTATTSTTGLSQTIDSGFYIAETSISGYYADNIVWQYTYNTFANGVTLCSKINPQQRIYLENPATIGLIIVSGANYGTSDNPTYMTISVKRWSGQAYGMEYEEGTWTPASDTSSYTISFTNTHTTAPFFYMISDTGEYYSTTYSNHNLAVWSPYLLTGVPLYYASGSGYYALGAYRSRGNSTTTLTNSSITVTSESSISNYMTNTGITASSSSSSYYWRAGRTYKWIAVWAPTT